MAILMKAKAENEIKRMPLAALKKEYESLASTYNKIVVNDLICCPVCGEFMTKINFYSSSKYAIGVFPMCKKCTLAMAEQRDKKSDKPNETKESVQKVLQLMDLPYLDDLYESAVRDVQNEVAEKNRSAPFLQYITTIKSLPQYRGYTWANSDFGYELEVEEVDEEAEFLLKEGKARFGSGYTDQDYIFLEREYEDWTTRYPCENKAQEVLYQRICCIQLEINYAQLQGKPTKELDKTLQDQMASLGIKPSQDNSNALTEAKTFGQLIQKWENEKPIPEPEEEFKDVDHIGLYIDVFFKGHLSKMMGLKNAFSPIYEKFIAKYTVKRPEYREDDDEEAALERIFEDQMELEDDE